MAWVITSIRPYQFTMLTATVTYKKAQMFRNAHYLKNVFCLLLLVLFLFFVFNSNFEKAKTAFFIWNVKSFISWMLYFNSWLHCKITFFLVTSSKKQMVKGFAISLKASTGEATLPAGQSSKRMQAQRRTAEFWKGRQHQQYRFLPKLLPPPT